MRRQAIPSAGPSRQIPARKAVPQWPALALLASTAGVISRSCPAQGGSGPWKAHEIWVDTRLGGSGIALVDLDGDGKLDVTYVTGYPDLHTIWHRNDGAGGFVASAGLIGAGALVFADVDADGDLDGMGRGRDVWFENIGSGGYTPRPGFGPGLEWAGDVDGDGLADLAGINRWARQQPDGSFESQVYSPDHSGGFSVATGDLDGDGDIDVVASITGYAQIWGFENPLLTTSKSTILARRQQHFGSPDDAGLGGDGSGGRRRDQSP